MEIDLSRIFPATRSEEPSRQLSHYLINLACLDCQSGEPRMGIQVMSDRLEGQEKSGRYRAAKMMRLGVSGHFGPGTKMGIPVPLQRFHFLFCFICLMGGEKCQDLPQDQLMRAPWSFRELPYNVSSSFVSIYLSFLLPQRRRSPAFPPTHCVSLSKFFHGVPAFLIPEQD